MLNNQELSLQQEYEAYLSIYKSMQVLPLYMRSQYFNNYFGELDKRLTELGSAIKYCNRIESQLVDDNLPYQISELENI